MDCVFCRIVKGDLPGFKVYEDEYTYASDDDNDYSRHDILVEGWWKNETFRYRIRFTWVVDVIYGISEWHMDLLTKI